MGRFRSSQSQANYAVSQKLAIGKPSHGKEREDGRIHSIGTARTYSASLKGVAAFIAERKLDSTGKGLASLTLEMANTYLEFRAQEVSQKQLNKDRQAMQILLGEKLAVTKSELEQALESRAYTQAQVQLIAGAQTKTHSLPTLIAADAGLRAHELLTLLPSKERGASSHRIWTNERFEGRKNVKRYSVVGKGGFPINPIALHPNASGNAGDVGSETNCKPIPTIVTISPEHNEPGWTATPSTGANIAKHIQIM